MTRLAVAIACLAAHPAYADLVYESYVGERPSDADRVMGQLRDVMLREFGVGAQPSQLIRQLRHLPQPGVSDRSLTAQKIFDQIELGYRDALHAIHDQDFNAVALNLTAALQIAHENPGVFVAEPNARTEMTRALVQLGISRARNGDTTGRDDAFTELVRSLGGQPLPSSYGPEAERFYSRRQSELTRTPRGKLLVSVSEPDAQIFVDEAGSGRGGTFSADMIPGPYRVLVMVRDRSLRYDVTVDAEKETKLEIDWDLETVLVASSQWVGLRLPSAPDRARAIKYAQALSRMSGHETQVIVLGMEQACGHTAVTGVRYNVNTAQQENVGKVLIGDDKEGIKLRALARFLVRDEHSADVILSDQPSSCAPTPVAASSHAPLWPAYATAGAGIAVIATGAYLVHLNGRGTCGATPPVQCPEVYGTGPYGWATVGVGVAAIGFGAYWYLTRRSPPSVEVAITPVTSGAMAAVYGRF